MPWEDEVDNNTGWETPTPSAAPVDTGWDDEIAPVVATPAPAPVLPAGVTRDPNGGYRVGTGEGVFANPVKVPENRVGAALLGGWSEASAGLWSLGAKTLGLIAEGVERVTSTRSYSSDPAERAAAGEGLLSSDRLYRVAREANTVREAYGWVTQQLRKEAETGPVADTILRGVEGAEQSIIMAFVGSVAGGAWLGPAAGTVGAEGATIAMFAADAANTASHQADDAGLTGDARTWFIAREAGIEGGITAIFSLVGLGGLEKSAGQATKQALRGTMKQALVTLGIRGLEELPEEIITETLHVYNQQFSGVLDLTPEEFNDTMKQTVLDTFVQTLMATSAMEAPRVIAASRGVPVEDVSPKDAERLRKDVSVGLAAVADKIEADAAALNSQTKNTAPAGEGEAEAERKAEAEKVFGGKGEKGTAAVVPSVQPAKVLQEARAKVARTQEQKLRDVADAVGALRRAKLRGDTEALEGLRAKVRETADAAGIKVPEETGAKGMEAAPEPKPKGEGTRVSREVEDRFNRALEGKPTAEDEAAGTVEKQKEYAQEFVDAEAAGDTVKAEEARLKALAAVRARVVGMARGNEGTVERVWDTLTSGTYERGEGRVGTRKLDQWLRDVASGKGNLEAIVAAEVRRPTVKQRSARGVEVEAAEAEAEVTGEKLPKRVKVSIQERSMNASESAQAGHDPLSATVEGRELDPAKQLEAKNLAEARDAVVDTAQRLRAAGWKDEDIAKWFEGAEGVKFARSYGFETVRELIQAGYAPGPQVKGREGPTLRALVQGLVDEASETQDARRLRLQKLFAQDVDVRTAEELEFAAKRYGGKIVPREQLSAKERRWVAWFKQFGITVAYATGMNKVGAKPLAVRAFVILRGMTPEATVFATGHESHHVIEQVDMTAARELVRLALELPGAVQHEALLAYVAGDEAKLRALEESGIRTSELAAQVVGAAWQREAFWDVLDQKLEPRLMTRILETVREVIVRFVHALRTFGLSRDEADRVAERVGRVYARVLDRLAREEVQQSLRYAAVVGTVAGPEVWHASPHRWDRASTEYIGTGEGAQAFGWGLYFTSEREVADAYVRAFKEGARLFVDGKEVADVPRGIEGIAHYYLTTSKTIAEAVAAARSDVTSGVVIEQYGEQFSGNDFERAAKWIEDNADHLELRPNPAYRYRAKLWGEGEPVLLEWDKPVGEEVLKRINARAIVEANTPYEFVPLRPGTSKAVVGGGRVYAALRETGTVEFWYAAPDGKSYSLTEADALRLLGNAQDGQSVYRYFSELLGSDRAASLFLLRAGIDGIRYPTGTLSGMAGTGYNYVVFDENAVQLQGPPEALGPTVRLEDYPADVQELLRRQHAMKKTDPERAGLTAQLEAKGVGKDARAALHKQLAGGGGGVTRTPRAVRTTAARAKNAAASARLATVVRSLATVPKRGQEVVERLVARATVKRKDGTERIRNPEALTRRLLAMKPFLVGEARVMEVLPKEVQDLLTELRAREGSATPKSPSHLKSMQMVIDEIERWTGAPARAMYQAANLAKNRATVAGKALHRKFQEIAKKHKLSARRLRKVLETGRVDKALAVGDHTGLSPVETDAYEYLRKLFKDKEVDVRTGRVVMNWSQGLLPLVEGENPTDIRHDEDPEGLSRDLVAARVLLDETGATEEGLARLREFLADKTWGTRGNYSPTEATLEDMVASTDRKNPFSFQKSALKTRAGQGGAAPRTNLWTRAERTVTAVENGLRLAPVLEAIKTLKLVVQERVMSSNLTSDKKLKVTRDTVDAINTWAQALTGIPQPKNWLTRMAMKMAGAMLTIHFGSQLPAIMNLVTQPMTDTRGPGLWDPRNWAFKNAGAEEHFELDVNQSHVLGQEEALLGIDKVEVPVLRQLFATMRTLGRGFELSDLLTRRMSFNATRRLVLRLVGKLTATTATRAQVQTLLSGPAMSELTAPQQAWALQEWVRGGAEALANYVASEHVANTYFSYDRWKRSLAEMGESGRLIAGLFTYPRSLAQRFVTDLGKVLRRSTPAAERARALARVAFVYVAVNLGEQMIRKLFRGQPEEDRDKNESWVYDTVSPYGVLRSVTYTPGGVLVSIMDNFNEFFRSATEVAHGNESEWTKFTRTGTGLARTFLPFYKMAVNAVNVALSRGLRDGSIDRKAAAKIREWLSSTYEYEEPATRTRTAVEALQAVIFGSDVGLDDADIPMLGEKAARYMALALQARSGPNPKARERARQEQQKVYNWFTRRGLSTDPMILEVYLDLAKNNPTELMRKDLDEALRADPESLPEYLFEDNTRNAREGEKTWKLRGK